MTAQAVAEGFFLGLAASDNSTSKDRASRVSEAPSVVSHTPPVCRRRPWQISRAPRTTASTSVRHPMSPRASKCCAASQLATWHPECPRFLISSLATSG